MQRRQAGFAGSLSGTVLGKKDTKEAGISASGIRSVIGGEYAGGCFGIADVDAGVQVSAGNETSILRYLLKLGQIEVLVHSEVMYITDQSVEVKDAGISD